MGGNLCSLRLTEYGDMRSFVSFSGEADSYGATEEMVNYFDCVQGGKLANGIRTYELTVRETFVSAIFKTILGKGLLLKNINRDQFLVFGIFSNKDDSIVLENSFADLTALC